jgi:hypothetical protein
MTEMITKWERTSDSRLSPRTPARSRRSVARADAWPGACGRAAGSYREGMRLGLTLAVIGAVIGIAGIMYGVLGLLAVME